MCMLPVAISAYMVLLQSQTGLILCSLSLLRMTPDATSCFCTEYIVDHFINTLP